MDQERESLETGEQSPEPTPRTQGRRSTYATPRMSSRSVGQAPRLSARTDGPAYSQRAVPLGCERKPVAFLDPGQPGQFGRYYPSEEELAWGRSAPVTAPQASRPSDTGGPLQRTRTVAFERTSTTASDRRASSSPGAASRRGISGTGGRMLGRDAALSASVTGDADGGGRRGRGGQVQLHAVPAKAGTAGEQRTRWLEGYTYDMAKKRKTEQLMATLGEETLEKLRGALRKFLKRHRAKKAREQGLSTVSPCVSTLLAAPSYPEVCRQTLGLRAYSEIACAGA